MSDDTDPVSKEAKFCQRFEYHRNLADRRWQYFAAFVALDGLLLSSWKDISPMPVALRLAVLGGSLLLSCAFLSLVDRARRRIRINAAKLNALAGEEMLDVGGRWPSPTGISFWLLAATIGLSVPWFLLLFEQSALAFFFCAPLYLLQVLVALCRR